MRRNGFITLLLLFWISLASAQEACPALVDQALTITGENCTDTQRNQVCYGHGLLNAEFAAEAPIVFEQSGDVAGIEALRRLVASPLDADLTAWGVALFMLRANLPETLPGQNVAVLVFGDVEIEPEPVTETALVELTASTGVNVRARPSTDAPVLQALARDQTVTASGRLEDHSWVRVQLPDDSSRSGWVSAPLLSGDVAALDVVTASQEVFGPMQAFYFKSGIGAAACAEVPESGILIQTPEGAGRVNLRVNAVDINLGSTAFLQAQPGALMTISLLEGSAQVRVNGVTVTVPAGARVQIALSDDLRPQGAPSAPQAYGADAFNTLPLRLLQRAIMIAPPLRSTANPQPAGGSTPSAPGGGGAPSNGSGSPGGSAPSVSSSAATSFSCSVSGDIPTSVTFTNNSSSTVNIYWISYDCGEVLYNTLEPGSSYVQGTYATHPWVVRDAATGAILGGPYASGDGSPFSVTISG